MFITTLTAALLSANISSSMLFVTVDTTTNVAKQETVDCRTIADPEVRLTCFDKLFSTSPIVKSQKTVEAEVIEDAETSDTALKTKNANNEPVIPQTAPVTVLKAPAKTSKSSVDNIANSSEEKMLERFGGEEFARNDDEAVALNEVTFTVAKLSKTLRKKQVFEFTNGQVWQNRNNTKIKLELGDEVVIKEGMLGSFYMQKEGLNRKILVVRVR